MANNEITVTEELEERIEKLEGLVLPAPPGSRTEALSRFRQALRNVPESFPGKRASRVANETCALSDVLPSLLDEPDEPDDTTQLDDIDDPEELISSEIELLEKRKKLLEGRLESYKAQRPGGELSPGGEADNNQGRQTLLETRITATEIRLQRTNARILALQTGTDLPGDLPEPPSPMSRLSDATGIASSLATRISGQAGSFDNELNQQFEILSGLSDGVSGLSLPFIEEATDIISNASQTISDSNNRAFQEVEEALSETTGVVETCVSINGIQNCESSQQEIDQAIEQEAANLNIEVPDLNLPLPPLLRKAFQNRVGNTLSAAAAGRTEGLDLVSVPGGKPGDTLGTVALNAAEKMPAAFAVVENNLPAVKADSVSALSAATSQINNLVP